MRGGSQAALIDTDMGCFVVKWLQNPQHRRVLINEAICSELLRHLRIATPLWAPVHVDRDFLARYPQARIEQGHGYREILPGRHFGSRVAPVVRPEFTWDLLPPGLIGRVRNRWDFLKALVFDVWVDNRDSRQAVFFRIPDYGFRAEMIDQGHCLGFDGAEWRFAGTIPRRPFPGIEELYLAPEAERIYGCVVAAIRQLRHDGMTSLIDQLPPEWILRDRGAITNTLGQLVNRASRLPTLVADTIAGIRACAGSDLRQDISASPIRWQWPLHLRPPH